jgi:hypothetical protein
VLMVMVSDKAEVNGGIISTSICIESGYFVIDVFEESGLK